VLFVSTIGRWRAGLTEKQLGLSYLINEDGSEGTISSIVKGFRLADRGLGVIPRANQRLKLV